jgi:hypothetical protein
VQPRRGGLWTGKVQARVYSTDGGIDSQFDIDAHVKLREKIAPLLQWTGSANRNIGSLITLIPEGSVVENSYKCSGYDMTCSGEGTITVSGEEHVSCASIWLKTVDVDTTAQFGFNIPRAGMYSVCLGTPDTAAFDVTWRTPYETTTAPIGFISPVIGHHPVLPQMPYMDPLIRTFENGPGKMQGSFSLPASDSASFNIDVSWSICREGVQCSEPPPLPPVGGTPEPGEPADDDNADDCTKLQRLIDAIRALRELYEGYEEAYTKAVEDRNGARDAIYGFSGTLSQFFVSLGSLATEAIGGAWGDLLGLLGSGAGLAQQNDVDNAAQAVLGIADTDLAFKPAEIEGIRNAVRKADQYLAQTGDDQGALRVYAGELGRSEAAQAKGKSVVKGLSIAVSIADYAEKTNGLADSIQKYDDYRREANLQQTNMNDVQNRMAEKQAEINEVRDGLDGPCPGIPSTSTERRPSSPGNMYFLVQSTSNATSEPQASAEDVRNAAAAVSEVNAKLERATPWLLPFLARETNGISPRLLAALLRRAEPELRAVAVDVEKAVRAGRELEGMMGGSANAAASRMRDTRVTSDHLRSD